MGCQRTRRWVQSESSLIDKTTNSGSSPWMENIFFFFFQVIIHQIVKFFIDDSQSRSADPCPMAEFLKGSVNGDGEKPPPYFPQPEDFLPAKSDGEMGPIGPWATGRTVFTPGGGFTGLRPVSDRYSITRFSPGEWRAHNRTFFNESNRMIHDAQLAAHNGKNSIQRVFKEADDQQRENKNRLSDRSREVFKWKSELERALITMTEEIELLEVEYRRVKSSLSVLTIPESIAGEFLQLRSTRLEPDLVRDEVNDELIKELGLCSEIRELLGRTKDQIERQAAELKSAKTRMEFDWTDKKDAYETDAKCIELANDSPLILWKPGAARFPGEQSTSSGYEHMTREALAQAEATRERSATLRATLDSIYVNSVRDLRTQADRVDAALAQKVSVTQQCCERLEKELLRCLYEISNVEETIKNLRSSTRNLDNTLKVAQSRLDNRLLRRNVESCRDIPQFGLIEEVKTLGQNVTMMMGQIERAEESQKGLVKARGNLEREIIVKRKSLYVDRERGQLLRSFYPSAVALSGHT
ncbi:tektin-4-like [Athalia rosae]|uniref:tektin-4-like n=1 Tax=Athalia rosae TaxID=37344 RepID=UPI0020342DAB|nr:tektin-4-like [Athalia rosae]